MTHSNEDGVNSQEEAVEGVNSEGQAANSQRQADDAQRSRSDSNYDQPLENSHSIPDFYEVNGPRIQTNNVTQLQNPPTPPASTPKIQYSTPADPASQSSKIQLREQEHSSPRKRPLESSKESPSKIPHCQASPPQLPTPGPSTPRANSKPFIPVVTISGSENLQERLARIMQAPSPSPLQIMVPRLLASDSASQEPIPSTSGTQSPSEAGRKVVITTKDLRRELRNIIKSKSPLPERAVATTARRPQPQRSQSAERVNPNPSPRGEPPRVSIPRPIIKPPLQRADNMLQTYIAPKRFQYLDQISRCLHLIRTNGITIKKGCHKYQLPGITVYLHSRLDGYKLDSAQNWSPFKIDQKIQAVQMRLSPLIDVIKMYDLHRSTITKKFQRLGIDVETIPLDWSDTAIISCLQDIKNRQAKLCSKSSYYHRILRTEDATYF